MDGTRPARRRIPSRSAGDELTDDEGAAIDAREDDEDVVDFAHVTLRENLHLTVNSVLSARFKEPRVREALTAELLAGIDAVVDDHIAAEELGRGMGAGEEIDAEPSRSVESAMEILRQRLHALLEGSRPGIKQGASAAMRLAPSVISSLKEFVTDEAKFAQAQQAATLVLSRYLHPVIARQVVSFAASAARRANVATSTVEGAGESEAPEEGPPASTES